MPRLIAACLCLLASAPARAQRAAVAPAAPPVGAKAVATVAWDVSGIELIGGPEFIAATRAALERLEPLPQFALVRRNIARIEESRCSGISVKQRTFHVGEKTWQAATVWYASTIAHDAYHVEVEGRSGGPLADAGNEETACLNFQSGVLAAMGSPEMMVKYVDALAKHPTYQNIGRGKSEFNTGTANDVCSERRW